MRSAAAPAGPRLPCAAGIPPLEPGPLYPVFKRRIPEPVFYIVPVLMCLALSLRHGSLTLPTAANPAMEGGGFFGESKMQGLNLFGGPALGQVAPFVVVEPVSPEGDGGDRLEEALAALAQAGIGFPIMAKPDVGHQGWGVRRLDDAAALGEYISGCGADLRLMLQHHVDLPGEAGVFYVREPGEERGRIVSMAFVYAAHVTGNGAATLEGLVAADPVLRKSSDIYAARNAERWREIVRAGEVVPLLSARSARLGAAYRDASAHMTPALEAAIDAIARNVQDFHFGRFDIRFASVAALERGEDFVILELNGAGAEMLHIWDGRKTLADAYGVLWRQYRRLFAIGAAMRRRGHRPASLRTMIRLIAREVRMHSRYPASG